VSAALYGKGRPQRTAFPLRGPVRRDANCAKDTVRYLIVRCPVATREGSYVTRKCLFSSSVWTEPTFVREGGSS